MLGRAEFGINRRKTKPTNRTPQVEGAPLSRAAGIAPMFFGTDTLAKINPGRSAGNYPTRLFILSKIYLNLLKSQPVTISFGDLLFLGALFLDVYF